MTLELDLQIAVDAGQLPTAEQMQHWLERTLSAEGKTEYYELTVRIVEMDESQQLNKDYRGKDKPTNVLSFPFEAPTGIKLALLGDLVVCEQVVSAEAEQQNKTLLAHWCHMLVHGCLHLLGYDHIKEAEAEIMEAKEVAILAELGFDDPYQLN